MKELVLKRSTANSLATAIELVSKKDGKPVEFKGWYGFARTLKSLSACKEDTSSMLQEIQLRCIDKNSNIDPSKRKEYISSVRSLMSENVEVKVHEVPFKDIDIFISPELGSYMVSTFITHDTELRSVELTVAEINRMRNAIINEFTDVKEGKWLEYAVFLAVTEEINTKHNDHISDIEADLADKDRDGNPMYRQNGGVSFPSITKKENLEKYSAMKKAAENRKVKISIPSVYFDSPDDMSWSPANAAELLDVLIFIGTKPENRDGDGDDEGKQAPATRKTSK